MAEPGRSVKELPPPSPPPLAGLRARPLLAPGPWPLPPGPWRLPPALPELEPCCEAAASAAPRGGCISTCEAAVFARAALSACQALKVDTRVLIYGAW